MSKFLLSGLAVSVLLAVLAAGAQAAVAEATTGTVKGRAPVAVPIITPTTPMAGDTVTVDFFSDLDGDVESGSTYQWFRTGNLVAGGGNTLTLNQAGIGGDLLTVRVLPKTAAAITDPSIGTAVTSAPIKVGVDPGVLNKFIAPDGVGRNWADADNYCQGLGARLPTFSELAELFAEATSSPASSPTPGIVANREMCSVHGWPLEGECGGGVLGSAYWSSTPYGAGHSFFNMRHGGQYQYSTGDDAGLYMAACMP